MWQLVKSIGWLFGRAAQLDTQRAGKPDRTEYEQRHQAYLDSLDEEV